MAVVISETKRRNKGDKRIREMVGFLGRKNKGKQILLFLKQGEEIKGRRIEGEMVDLLGGKWLQLFLKQGEEKKWERETKGNSGFTGEGNLTDLLRKM